MRPPQGHLAQGSHRKNDLETHSLKGPEGHRQPIEESRNVTVISILSWGLMGMKESAVFWHLVCAEQEQSGYATFL